MEKTKLLYLNNFKQYICDAHVLEITQDQNNWVVVLDQTVFYPQGGGQPCDQGTITGKNSVFIVTDVRLLDGIARHKGTFNGQPFDVGEPVTCQIDQVRRILDSRIHSAGHVIDKALFELGYTWAPGKSYHFPNGPYVEYHGSLAGIDVAKLKADIEQLCMKWCTQGLAVVAHVADKKQALQDEQLKRRCPFIADLPEEKPIYVISYGNNFASPCSGTHVADVSEIGSITIRKIKESDGVVRISYDVKRD